MPWQKKSKRREVGIVVRIYKTIDGAIHQIQEPEEGCWIALTNPTATEIFEFSEKFDIEVDDLRSPLDEEERSRIEVEDNYTLILVDVPMIEERNDKDWYGTIPLGIIVTGSMIITICLESIRALMLLKSASVIVSAAIASTTTTARGTITGSCRPLISSSRFSPLLVTVDWG